MKFVRLAIAAVVAFPIAAAAAMPVTQPYRPLNEQQQWTIEGQSYGLLKVRVLINGQLVADGPMKNANFTSSYNNRPVRVTCAIGSVRMTGPADRYCAVYVDNELAANLIFIRRD